MSDPTPDYSDPLSRLQDALVARIAAAPLLAARAVQVHPERRGDIEQTVLNALARIGAAVIVLEPINGTVEDPSSPQLLVETEFVFEVIESVARNRAAPPEGSEVTPTYATALQIMCAALVAVHGQPTGLLNPAHALGCWQSDNDVFRRLPHKILSIYQATVRAGVFLNP